MAEVKKPVTMEVQGDIDPGAAPLPPDLPSRAAMVTLAEASARPRGWLSRWFWRLLAALLSFGLSLWAWDFVTGLFARSPLLGWIAFVLIAGLLFVTALIGLKELAGFARLKRLDRLREAAEHARVEGDVAAAKSVAERMAGLYAGRPEFDWQRERFARDLAEAADADGLLATVERDFLLPLDRLAIAEIEAAARRVATITAVVPLAFADVAAALLGNMKMIRRIAEIYGGRAGTLGSLRLVRTVLAHLVATGAVAVGDDMIGSVAGGSLLAKLSRRFGEGVINGALTARVGMAALEVCRPLPFRLAKRPSVSGIVGRALKGLFV